MSWLAIVGLLGAPTPGLRPVDRVCPVGGRSFEGFDVEVPFPTQVRLDFRQVGPLPPVEECPDNGFVLYKAAFTPAEIATLTEVVESRAYRVARRKEGPYARSVRLDDALGATGDDDRAMLLLFALWESEDRGDDRLHDRLLAEVVALREEALKGQGTTSAKAWMFTLQLADLRRQQGDFEGCRSTLGRLDLHTLGAGAGAAEFVGQIRARCEAGDTAPAEFVRSGPAGSTGATLPGGGAP
jgi:hypothetical protein